MIEPATEARPREVLLIEDSDPEATGLAEVLHHAGASVDVVRDRDEAVEYLSATGRHDGRDADHWPDLILLDMGMDDHSARRILRWIRWEVGITRTPVVVLTSSGQERDMLDAYRFGANSYLVKPDRSEDLEALAAEVVHYWLQRNV